jgi:hypothetical protein
MLQHFNIPIPRRSTIQPFDVLTVSQNIRFLFLISFFEIDQRDAVAPQGVCWRSPRRIICSALSAWARRRVFGNADHSGADRTSGRAGEAQE